MTARPAAAEGFCDELFKGSPPKGPRPIRWLARQWCRWVTGICAKPGGLRLLGLINLVCLLLLRRLNAALELLHLPDQDGFGMFDLAKGHGRAESAITTWDFIGNRLSQAGILGHGGRGIAVTHAVIDVLFSVAYVSLLALVVLALARRLKAATARERALRKILRWSFFALPLLLLAEVAENLLQILTVTVADDAPGADLGSDPLFVSLAEALRVAFWVKLALLLGAVAPVLAAVLARLRHEWNPLPVFFGAASLMRVQLVLIAVFAFVMLIGPTADQFQDALRGWSTRWGWAAGGLGAILALSITTFVSARHVVGEAGSERRNPLSSKLTLGVGLVLSTLGALASWKWSQGEGVLMAGAVLVLVGALSWPIEGFFRADAAKKGAAEGAAKNGAAEGAAEGGPSTSPSAEEQAKKATRWQVLPAYLAIVPVVVLAVAMVNALVPEVLGAGKGWGWLVAMALGLFALAWKLPDLLQRRTAVTGWDQSRQRPKLGGRFWAFTVLVLIGGIALWFVTLQDVWRVASALGSIAFLGAFLTELMLVIGLLGIAADRRGPPPAVSVLGFQRTPVVLFVLVVAIGGTLLDRQGTFHAVRLDERAAPTSVTLRDYTSDWVRSRAGGDDGPPRAIPLVLVAAAGGGIRAASWTALVTNCVFGPQPDTECRRPGELGDTWGSLFAVSGASGGTVGLASVFAERLSAGRSEPGWVLERLGTDLLSPSVAWQFLVEAPLVLPRVAPGMDRAEALERAWARSWSGQTAVCTRPGEAVSNPAELPFHSLWPTPGPGTPWCSQQLPLFLPNGTSLTDGCRFNSSMFDTSPENVNCGAARVWRSGESPQFAVTRDLVDFLCTDEDVRLSTAAFLSARFPFVSPTGWVSGPDQRGRGDDSPCDDAAQDQVAFVGDAGYRDNTGASALLELWEGARGEIDAAAREGGACVVPIFVEINNGYIDRKAPTSGGRLYESVGPLAGAIGVFSKRDAAGPELASALFASTVTTTAGEPLTRFVSFALAPHPGVQAPLGWSLSDSSKTDLRRQLSEDRNSKALDHLYKLLAPGGLRCS